MTRARFLCGDALDVLRQLPSDSVDCVVTSPPYYFRRDNGHAAQIGLESTVDQYVERLVSVFGECRRVMRPHATLWVNLGDSYAGLGGHTKLGSTSKRQGRANVSDQHRIKGIPPHGSIKAKDLALVPERFSIAMQADRWYVRARIAWIKTAPAPESVLDRPSSAWEHVYLFSKRARYTYNRHAALRESGANGVNVWTIAPDAISRQYRFCAGCRTLYQGDDRRRIVAGRCSSCGTDDRWLVHTSGYPRELARRAIEAGTVGRSVVLDPFMGSGTTAIVAQELGHDVIGVELLPEYVALQMARMAAA